MNVRHHMKLMLLLINAVPILTCSGYSQLCINEFMTSNKTGLTDNQGNVVDWIEIYNPGDHAVDLAGYYLTDTIGDPGKCKIRKSAPDSTTIKPHGYIVLFADKSRKKGILHLKIGLNKNGEQIGLYKKVNKAFVKIDFIGYRLQFNDVSYGRVPDGSPNWKFIQTPSPGASNNNAIMGKPDTKRK